MTYPSLPNAQLPQITTQPLPLSPFYNAYDASASCSSAGSPFWIDDIFWDSDQSYVSSNSIPSLSNKSHSDSRSSSRLTAVQSLEIKNNDEKSKILGMDIIDQHIEKEEGEEGDDEHEDWEDECEIEEEEEEGYIDSDSESEESHSYDSTENPLLRFPPPSTLDCTTLKPDPTTPPTSPTTTTATPQTPTAQQPFHRPSAPHPILALHPSLQTPLMHHHRRNTLSQNSDTTPQPLPKPTHLCSPSSTPSSSLPLLSACLSSMLRFQELSPSLSLSSLDPSLPRLFPPPTHTSASASASASLRTETPRLVATTGSANIGAKENPAFPPPPSRAYSPPARHILRDWSILLSPRRRAFCDRTVACSGGVVSWW
ncbi:hypothetical protein MMC06_005104 [Schaereria dolodes]|nr:hypothetical protein [Schaereria dolodes]